ncbi:MAG: hypothetical protein ABI488_23285 [Polyangiaceae bacterium]
MLRASGETIEGPRPSDSFNVFVDREGDLVVLLMDIQTPLEASDGFLNSLMREAEEALREHAPLHSVVSGLEMHLAARPGVEAGLIVVRLSQRDAKVEVLNAGMPAIANAGPGEHVTLHPALSSAVGKRVGEVHPYELVTLAWGSTWLAVSDGVLNGSLDAENVQALCSKLGLSERGFALTTATSDQRYDAFQAVLPAARFLRDDATFVLVSADPKTRFKSGIV